MSSECIFLGLVGLVLVGLMLYLGIRSQNRRFGSVRTVRPNQLISVFRLENTRDYLITYVHDGREYQMRGHSTVFFDPNTGARCPNERWLSGQLQKWKWDNKVVD